jgi:hypothetical protein
LTHCRGQNEGQSDDLLGGTFVSCEDGVGVTPLVNTS